MKRTKNINHSSFRKSWSARHLTPVALAVTAVFMLAGCEKSDETVSLYQNADDCSAANPGKAAECTTAYTNAVKEGRAHCAEVCHPRETASPSVWRRPVPADASPGGRRPGKPGAGAKQRQLLDAADGRLHDGPPDGRRHGTTAAAVQLEKSGQPGLRSVH